MSHVVKRPLRAPAQLPFLDTICQKLNLRVNRQDPERLAALYQRHLVLNHRVATIEGAELAFVRQLGLRYNAPMLTAI